MKPGSFFIVSIVLAFSLLLVNSASALFLPTNDQAATLVLGQPDFTSGAIQTSQAGMMYPQGVAVDPTSGKVFVADTMNSRVLRFNNVSALTNGANAEAVLGQPDFTGSAAQTTQGGMNFPGGIAVDSAGRLWVADTHSNRVLRFDNAASKANGADADGVLGQQDFTSASESVTASGVSVPSGVAVDTGGRLWVADGGNHRVLRFDDAAAKPNGGNADGVLGQPDFASNAARLTRNGMNNPNGVVVDAAGRLWVADTFNGRVLRFDNAATKTNGADADGVLGQQDFTSNTGFTNLSQNGMWVPASAAVDPSGRLYVSDGFNRVLVFDLAASLPNGANASYVLGQTDFTSSLVNPGGISAATLAGPFGLWYDPAANVLWVADIGNSRVLMYGQPYATLHILPFVGLVRLFLPPGVTPIGSISIETRDGNLHTLDVSPDVRILPRGRASQLGAGSFVTLLARMDPLTGHLTVFQIVVHPEGAGPGSVP
jgi:sugar lactone lactonase YvrE